MGVVGDEVVLGVVLGVFRDSWRRCIVGRRRVGRGWGYILGRVLCKGG